jgi:hypothetical protein
MNQTVKDAFYLLLQHWWEAFDHGICQQRKMTKSARSCLLLQEPGVCKVVNFNTVANQLFGIHGASSWSVPTELSHHFMKQLLLPCTLKQRKKQRNCRGFGDSRG